MFNYFPKVGKWSNGFKKMPNLSRLLDKFSYDPITGKFMNAAETKEVGWSDHKGYRRVRFEGETFLIHRLAYYIYYRVDPKTKEVDHCNGNTSDNRIKNLRCVKHRINAGNTKQQREKDGRPPEDVTAPPAPVDEPPLY